MSKSCLKRLTLAAFVFLGMLIAIPIVLTWRAVQREQLNRALIVAVENNETPAVIALLKQGADPNTRTQPPQQVSLWRLLLDQLSGRRRQSPAPASPTCLILALLPYRTDGRRIYRLENLPLVQALLDHGADVNTKAQLGRYKVKTFPLAFAISSGRFATARLLLDRGADVNAIVEHYQPLGGIAFETIEMPVWMYPLAHVTSLRQANSDLFAAMLTHVTNVNTRDSCGDTALLWAIQNEYFDVVPLLLARHADLNVRGRNGCTALIAADDVATIRLLLSRHADVNIKDDRGETALSYAMDAKQTPQIRMIVALLKKAGGKPLPANRPRRPVQIFL